MTNAPVTAEDIIRYDMRRTTVRLQRAVDAVEFLTGQLAEADRPTTPTVRQLIQAAIDLHEALIVVETQEQALPHT